MRKGLIASFVTAALLLSFGSAFAQDEGDKGGGGQERFHVGLLPEVESQAASRRDITRRKRVATKAVSVRLALPAGLAPVT